jgi:hypothetical protein
LLLTLAGTAWLALRYTSWIGTLKPELLDEPIATVAEGVARWPAPPGVEELMRRSALLMVSMTMYVALNAFFAWQSGQTAAAVFALLGVVPLVAIVLEAQRLPHHAVGAPAEPARAGGSWAEFVTTGLLGSRLALGVALFAIGAKTSGLVDTLATLSATRGPLWSEMLDTALQLAVIAAVLVGKPSHGRKAAAISLLAGLVGERLGGQGGKLVVATIAMFITLRAAHKNSVREALRLTMEFELLVALGRIGGRLVAGVLLGPLAITLGEALGEQFTALSVSARLEPIEVGHREASAPFSPASLRLGALSTICGVALIAWAPWKTFGRKAPSSWKTVKGQGWSALMPGQPARQTSTIRLANGQSMPLHHYTSLYKGSLFTVFELEWPAASVERDPDGLLTTNQLLPFQQLNGCEGLLIGVTRDNAVRCLSSADETRLAVGCVTSAPFGNRFVEGELAFLANLKTDAQSFEGQSRGLKSPEQLCVLDPEAIRELKRKVDQLR